MSIKPRPNKVKKLKISLEELGAEVFLIKADLNKTNETKKIIPYAYKMMKGIDCLINNASIFENDNIENFDEKVFDKHLNINLIKLDQELIDYVILHELTHLNIKNHSKTFWQELEKLEPKARILDKKLKNYNLNYKI